MNSFEIWVLEVLEHIPEFDIEIPSNVYTYIDDFKQCINIFINWSDFISILSSIVLFGFIHLSIALIGYIGSYKNK